MFVYLKTPDVGTQGQNEGGRLVGGEVRARVGSFFSLFFFFFLFSFFYIIYSLLRYKKSHGALAMAKTKPKIQNVLTKETSGTKNSSTGVRTGPRPTCGRQIKPSKSKETLLKTSGQHEIKTQQHKNANLALLR